MSRGHRQIDHTADLALELWAPTEAELLEEAGQALVAILTDGAEVVDDDGQRTVRFDAVDREDRLVQWMNEVLYWATVQGFLMTEAELDPAPALARAPSDGTGEGCSLVGRVRGRADGRALLQAELKSATYHGLTVECVDGLWRAQVVVDV